MTVGSFASRTEEIGVGMKLSVPFQRIAAVIAIAAAAVLVPVVSSSTPVSAAPCTTDMCAGGEYHALTPARILDTRTGLNDVDAPGAKILRSSGSTFSVKLLDMGGVPASATDVLAVSASITVVNPTQSGFLGAYATGSPSVNSVLNFGVNQTVPNLAVLRAGTNGEVTISITGAANGTVHVLIDVFGWWSTSAYRADTADPGGDARGARLFTPAAPGRILDTRTGTHIYPDSDLAVKIRGATVLGTSTVIVPNDPDVVGVLINVTSLLHSTQTYLSVVPDPITPGSPPTTSNLNMRAGQTKANLVLVPVGADGNIHVYNSAGFSHLLIDVMGYMVKGEPETTRRGRVIPLTAPFRVLDTRNATFGGVPLGPGQAEDWSFANFAGSVTVGGVSVGNQSSLLGNLTNASLARQYPTVGVNSYLTVYPSPAASPPNYSNVNTVEGAVPIPNMTLVPYGPNNTVRVFNARGYAHYILDVSAVVLAD